MRARLISNELLQSFRRSAALQRSAGELSHLAALIKAEPRKVVPVSQVARLLRVSVRLLWKWIDQGWISTYERPSEHYRKGISKPGFTRFLKRLAEYQSYAKDMWSPVVRGRPPKARERLREGYRAKLVKDGMTPAQCAEVVGISADSALRALKKGWLRSYRPSPCRYRVGQKKRAARAR